jgi:hypothetical protein
MRERVNLFRLGITPDGEDSSMEGVSTHEEESRSKPLRRARSRSSNPRSTRSTRKLETVHIHGEHRRRRHRPASGTPALESKRKRRATIREATLHR